ncbi:inorganic phosphate transporter [Gracilibacillus oryzae]|uniref:Inorganic phosphate transporter n=1 Tax=Gracilibacillus oryzae TaxID=1672701 RepID=A0A7C8GWC3_9BACI|nr:inorganic phosphate transporter [Gracilibacillus oryzae]KAB8139409.1 inorganic phosphate transporter [Gracilibacillus oryzae]
MNMLVIIAISAACLFAFNIGASGSAASMGVAYGAKVVKSRRIALLLAGLGAIIGALWGGHHVTNTLGKGIISEELIDVPIAAIILLVAGGTLLITNYIGIPLSTSEVTVGAIVGVGISFQQLYVTNILHIISLWLIIPFAAFMITFSFEKIRTKWLHKFKLKRSHKWLAVLLLLTGFFEAIAAGMNNVANALGPLVGADIMSMEVGLPLFAVIVALGSFLFGGKVLETNAKKITSLSLANGVVISSTTGFLVIIASFFGIPIPMTQVTTTAIVGISATKSWQSVWKQKIIHQIVKVWVTSPVISLVIAFSLTEMIVKQSFYTVVILILTIMITFVLLKYEVKVDKKIQKQTRREWQANE